MYFDQADLTQHFDRGTYERGDDYARKGKVRVAQRDGDLLIGEVGGSGAEVYRQTIRFKSDRNGIGFQGSCSCPMSYNCKHVVAVLLADLERRRRALPPSTEVAAVRREQWVQQVALLSQAAEAGASAPAVWALAWVLAPGTSGGVPRLHVRRARLRKNGDISSSTAIHDIHALLRAMPASAAPGDEESLRLFAALQAGSVFVDGAEVTGPIGARLLASLCAAGRLLVAWSDDALRRNDVFYLRPGPRRQAELGWRSSPADDDRVRLGWRFAEDGTPIAVVPTEPPYYIADYLLGEATLPAALAGLPPASLLALVEQAPALAPEERAGMASRLAGLGLDRLLPLPQAVATRRRNDVAPVPSLRLDCMFTRTGWRRTEEWHDFAEPFFDYDGLSTDGVDEPVLRSVEGNVVQLIERNAAAEAAALAQLAALGFFAPPPDSPLSELPHALRLADEAAWIAFAQAGIPRLRAAGWQIAFEGDYRYELAAVDDWYAELGEEGSEWFSLELGIIVDGERHSLLPILVQMVRATPRAFDAAALAGRADDDGLVVELPNFDRVALPWRRVKPILSILGELYFGERLGRAVVLPYLDAARLAELERAAQLRWMGGERLRELGRKLDGFGGIVPVAPPAGLQATLRPYQLGGLAWLQFLREYGFGGILADDMGLGKTVQTLAHILLEKESGRLDAPALVVAPTSLMPNWQAEAARFAPGLRVLLLHGKERGPLFDAIGQADLVLTTYALLGRDEAALRQHRYHLLILDEAQYIKNSRTKAAQTARLLDARHRLCLTGTPVQNHLGELWSQFHFLMPGLLGDEKKFKADYRKPIEGGGDALRKDLLVRRVKPFMLRRTKDKVATELPPKTEIVLPIELGSVQRDLYETVRVAMDRKVQDEIDRKGLARSQIVILEALLKLRQVCCDPRLLKPQTETGSAKLQTLMDLLDTLRSEGRKVLVFSQFTSMLALIGEALRARGADYVELTGNTLDRAAPVAAFQEGTVGVFLISLKAGGVGLNLTAADTVIHYDPWWNPASENQATDRAWRIGQRQPVFVYKLIARGTLEEKIQEMQRRKGELADAVLAGGGDAELTPGIGADDLRAIFSLALPEPSA